MRLSQQKLKLLYLLKILIENTDDEHSLTIAEIISRLAEQGISAERKSIYDDIDCLKLFGVDVCTEKGKSFGYYVGSRDFELPELKLLVDSVQSSKFITHKKSMELISKIEKLTSTYNARKLDRQVFVTNRVKTFNERIYYNVDKIHEAIANERQITFKYFELDINKEKAYRKNGELYTESPISLSWDDENYYLITYKDKYKAFTHYRVDKMDDINIIDTQRTLPENDFDLSSYTKRVFSMFGGQEVSVTIEFEKSLLGVFYDRFGTDITVLKADEHYQSTLKVAISPQFFAWIMSFGSKVKIISPDFVIEEQKKLLEEILNNYK